MRRLHRALALAAIGWYLLAPPLPGNTPGLQDFNLSRTAENATLTAALSQSIAKHNPSLMPNRAQGRELQWQGANVAAENDIHPHDLDSARLPLTTN
jgi:hypothetical protein